MAEKKKMPVWLIVVLVVAGLGVLCCGGALVATKFGLDKAGDMAQQSVETHPAVIEHIGEIQSFDMSLTKTGEAGVPNGMAYEVVGTKGSGVIIVVLSTVPDENGAQTMVDGSLELSDGTVIDLVE